MKVTNRIKFEKGCSALVTRGENAGVIGRVEDVREGIFSLPKRALLSFGNRSVELPVDIVIPVVPEEPAIKVSQE
jgi:small subunit ribosomal protein S4e